MNCERVRPYLTAYAAGETERATHAWVDSHLQTCAACSAEVARHSAIGAALRTAPPDAIEEPVWLTGAVMAGVRERQVDKARRLVPIAPVPEVVRVIADNREAILQAAGTMAVAAGVAWLGYRALIRATRRFKPA